MLRGNAARARSVNRSSAISHTASSASGSSTGSAGSTVAVASIARSATPERLATIDWASLSPKARTIALTIGPLLVLDCSMAEIARALGQSSLTHEEIVESCCRAELEAQLEQPDRFG
jgi:hypothetical protein